MERIIYKRPLILKQDYLDELVEKHKLNRKAIMPLFIKFNSLYFKKHNVINEKYHRELNRYIMWFGKFYTNGN